MKEKWVVHEKNEKGVYWYCVFDGTEEQCKNYVKEFGVNGNLKAEPDINDTPELGIESKEPNVDCDNCGRDQFRVCWHEYPYTGGYCRLVCSKCGKQRMLINDYS